MFQRYLRNCNFFNHSQGDIGIGLIGPQGPQGAPGPPGSMGLQGIKGDIGVSNAIFVHAIKIVSCF